MNKKYPRASPPDTLRSERDRRVDEILSGRSSQQRYHDSPDSSSASSALSVNEGQNEVDSMKLKPNLISFGDTVKHKFGGLFGSSKSNRDHNSPVLQLPESSNDAMAPSHHGGRIFGRAPASTVVNDNHRAYKNNTTRHEPEEDNALSRPISPNPFLMASSGINRQTSHNSNVSPFARFDENSSRTSSTPPNNIFNDI